MDASRDDSSSSVSKGIYAEAPVSDSLAKYRITNIMLRTNKNPVDIISTNTTAENTPASGGTNVLGICEL
jgi:hypothetical protein